MSVPHSAVRYNIIIEYTKDFQVPVLDTPEHVLNPLAKYVFFLV